MKKSLTLFAFALLSLASYSQGIEIYYYPDGEIDVSGTVIELSAEVDNVNQNFDIINVSGSAQELRIERVKIIELEGTEEFMYWGTAVETADGYSSGLVTPNNPFITPEVAVTEDGEGAWLSTNFISNGIAGCVQNRFYVIDEDNNRLDSVDILYCSTLGVTESDKIDLSVYPNPTSEIINVSLGEEFEQVKFTLYNVNGETIITEQLNAGTNTIDISQVPNGIYIYRIADRKELIESKKITVYHSL